MYSIECQSVTLRSEIETQRYKLICTLSISNRVYDISAIRKHLNTHGKLS